MTIPIVDSHFHIWRQEDLPWLTGPTVDRIFGPYGSICRDYPVEEYLHDQEHAGVAKSVYVQANWPAEHYERETRWIHEVAEKSGWPHGMVAYAHLTEGDVRPQLDLLARYSLVRGVRQQLHWHAKPAFRFAPVPDQITTDTFNRNFERLKDYGFSFDLQLFPAQLADGAKFVSQHPKTAFILVHAGMLEDTTEQGVEEWEAGLTALAKSPNVFVKLSGLGTFIHRNDPAHIAFVVGRCLAIFGANRCMFGSNFPIEKIWTEHPPLMHAYLDALAGLSFEQQDAVLRGTATRVYRLDAPRSVKPFSSY